MLSVRVITIAVSVSCQLAASGPASEHGGDLGELIGERDSASRSREVVSAVIEDAARLIDSGRLGEAIGILEKEAARNPGAPRVWFTLAIARFESGDTLSAIEASRRAVEADPDWPQALWLSGTLLGEAGELGPAEKAFGDAIALRPRDAGAYLQRARFLILRAGDAASLERGIRDITRSLELGSPDAATLGLLGVAHRKLGNDRRAEEAFRAILRDDPANVDAVCELVRLYDRAGRSGRADRLLADLAPAERPPSDRAKLALCRAEHAQVLGLEDAAVEGWFREALDAVPAHPDAALAFAHWLDGRSRNADAIPVLEQAVAAHPRDPRLGPPLAWALAATGRGLDRAAMLIAPARERDPANPYTADTAAWIAFQRGDLDEAVRLLPLLESISDRIPVVAYHVGAIHHAAGRNAAAAPHLRRALAAGANFPGRRDAVALLARLDPP